MAFIVQGPLLSFVILKRMAVQNAGFFSFLFFEREVSELSEIDILSQKSDLRLIPQIP